MRQYITNSPAETEGIASDFAETLRSGDIVALKGPMGAGKTAFIRGIAKFFGAQDEVSSPTFAIMNEYDGGIMLHHYDMYRITDWENLYSTGFFDDLENDGIIILIEWSENIMSYLPDDVIEIQMAYGEKEGSRIIKIQSGEEE